MEKNSYNIGNKNAAKDEARTNRLNLRFSDSEINELAKRAAHFGVSKSEYIRKRVFGKKLVSHVNQELAAELRRQGGLLKHIHNETQGIYSEKTIKMLDDIRDTIKRIS